jgi:hypothetical protein
LLQLSRQVVQNINLEGGSFLGVSRGAPSHTEIVDSIQACINLYLYFCDSKVVIIVFVTFLSVLELMISGKGH